MRSEAGSNEEERESCGMPEEWKKITVEWREIKRAREEIKSKWKEGRREYGGCVCAKPATLVDVNSLPSVLLI